MKNRLCQNNVIFIQNMKEGNKDGEISDSGEMITEVAVTQGYLTKIGIYNSGINGVYGSEMAKSIKIIQKSLGLKITGSIDDNVIDAVFNSCN